MEILDRSLKSIKLDDYHIGNDSFGTQSLSSTSTSSSSPSSKSYDNRSPTKSYRNLGYFNFYSFGDHRESFNDKNRRLTPHLHHHHHHYHHRRRRFLSASADERDRNHHLQSNPSSSTLLSNPNRSNLYECCDQIFHKISILFLKSNTDLDTTWEMINYLIREQNLINEPKAENFLTSSLINQYLCLIQQLISIQNSYRTKTNRLQNRLERKRILERINTLFENLILDEPAILSSFVPQFAKLSKFSSKRFIVFDRFVDRFHLDQQQQQQQQTLNNVSNIYFANIIETNFIFNNLNRIEIPINEEEIERVIEWLYPNANLLQLYKLIDLCRSIIVTELKRSNILFENNFDENENFDETTSTKEISFEEIFKAVKQSQFYFSMPILDKLLMIVLMMERTRINSIKHTRNTEADGIDGGVSVSMKKFLIAFCLKASLFEHSYGYFKRWLNQAHHNQIFDRSNRTDYSIQTNFFNLYDNIDENNGDDCDFYRDHNCLGVVKKKSKPFTNDNGDDVDVLRKHLASPYLVGYLYPLAIDLALLASSFSRPEPLPCLLSIRLNDLDFEIYLKRAMNAINIELNAIDEDRLMPNFHPQQLDELFQNISLQEDEDEDQDEEEEEEDSEQFQHISLRNGQNNYENDLNISDIERYDSQQSLSSTTSKISSSSSPSSSLQSSVKNSIPNKIIAWKAKRQLLERIKIQGANLLAPINNKWLFDVCDCCDLKQWLLVRDCCQSKSCLDCLKQYYTTRIKMGILSIECIGTKCKQLVYRTEVMSRLAIADKALYGRLLLMQSSESDRSKPCPRCNKIFSLSFKHQEKIKRQRKMFLFKHILMLGLNHNQSNYFKVKCDACQLDWCFKCHSPWHQGISCKDYVKGDSLLKTWAKHSNSCSGDVNAQKCPRCKIYIQRISGCDHMHCTRCKTDFCYRCGDRIRSIRFFGDHYSRLSVLGCKFRFKPEKPIQRKLIRGAVLGSKLMVLPVITTVGICTGALVLAIGVAAMPFIGSVYFYNRLRNPSQSQLACGTLYQNRLNNAAVVEVIGVLNEPNLAVLLDMNEYIPQTAIAATQSEELNAIHSSSMDTYGSVHKSISDSLISKKFGGQKIGLKKMLNSIGDVLFAVDETDGDVNVPQQSNQSENNRQSKTSEGEIEIEVENSIESDSKS
ncbi:Putative E3 ubiquitin-protein ligase [Sarcoptes scabiei]|uniref:RBR-type E3 ubiquitin transferase n=1 Tax=Sarcoptes scabiei TaxID=52283 RepID=A0A834R5I9_SARSC|nr:Putative E3 ubiquitin-protein ligase [Sarcoptes scabiei]